MALSKNSLHYYKHSGKFGSSTPFLLSATVLVVPVVLGLIYSLALHYIPLIIIDFLLTMGFGMGIGISLNWVITKCKVRNENLARAALLVSGLFGCYVSWVGSAWINLNFEFFILNPVTLLEYIQLLANEGAWSISSINAPPIVAYFFWVVELGIILFYAYSKGMMRINTTPFCESTDSWANSIQLIAPLERPADEELLANQIESGDFGTLIRLKKLKSFDRCLALELIGHSSDINFRLLNLKRVETSYNKEGKAVTKVSYLLKHFKTDDSTNQLLQDYFKSLDEEAAAAAEIPNKEPIPQFKRARRFSFKR